jgi:PPM family protein phosphatase
MCVVWSHTEAGGHEVNEDAFVIQPHPEGGACWLGALTDGQGGQAGGAEASRGACRSVIESLSARRTSEIFKERTWFDIFQGADERVLAQPEAGYTTLIGFAVTNGRIIGASNGDSALWMTGEDGSILDLTADQAKNPPIGSGVAAPTPFASKLPASWIVLGMTDGVWKYVGREGIREALEKFRGPTLLETLLSRARLPRSGGLQDDFTAIVLQYEG